MFVQAGPGAAPQNVTQGGVDGSSWYAPQWSPDGEHLALASTRLGGSLWVWNVRTRALKMLVARSAQYGEDPPERWLDATRLIYSTRNTAKVADVIQTQAVTARAWESSIAGVVPTSSILTSGSDSLPQIDITEQARLLIVDLNGGVSEATLAVSDDWTTTQGSLAFIQRVPFAPRPSDNAVVVQGGLSQLGLLDIDGMESTPRALSGVEHEAVLGPLAAGDSLRWSPSGAELAFLAFRSRTDPTPSLYRIRADTGRGRITPLRGVGRTQTSSSVVWTGDGDVLIYGQGEESRSLKDGWNWWNVHRNGTISPLTSRLVSAPRFLLPLPERHAFAAMVEGNLWRISSRTGAAENLTHDLASSDGIGLTLAWPSSPDEYATYGRLVLSSGQGENRTYWIFDLETGEHSALAPPAAGTELVAFSAVSGDAIFKDEGARGLRLWRVTPAKPPELLIERNQFLADVAPNRWQRIDYTSERGEPLVAWLLLPYDYESGHRYPMVTYPYPEYIQPENDPLGGRNVVQQISSYNWLNLQLLAGRGYVVLLPSMPLDVGGQADDPYLRLTEGVMPAVDRAIEVGTADPDRLFLMGHSFGGFATAGLVTQTNRFRAAIALSGLTNIASAYGTFSGRLRYTDRPHLDWRTPSDITGQIRMAVPPWADPQRYVRNSPLMYADRVQTPIMLIHGDMDQVPIQQSEEFFRAMYEQGKRAEFVRYWGEYHSIESPANVRDMWANIFRWFAEFGGIPVEPADPSGTSGQAR